MNSYRKMRERQQAEVNAFPFGFAFSDEQFNKTMKEWGLCHGRDGKPTKNDCSQVVSIGAGGFVRKKDVDAMHAMFDRHSSEMRQAISDDKDGTGFIYEMFLYEMHNHEFGYTWDPYDTLAACGLTMEQVAADNALAAGFMKAKDEVLREEQEE